VGSRHRHWSKPVLSNNMTKVYGSLSPIKLVSSQILPSFSWMSLFTV
jgi:hypothetical protein